MRTITNVSELINGNKYLIKCAIKHIDEVFENNIPGRSYIEINVNDQYKEVIDDIADNLKTVEGYEIVMYTLSMERVTDLSKMDGNAEYYIEYTYKYNSLDKVYPHEFFIGKKILYSLISFTKDGYVDNTYPMVNDLNIIYERV